MGEWYDEDEDVKPTGQQGNGYYRAQRFGKQGYVNQQSRKFIPDEEPELPKQKPIGVDFRITEPSGPSAWDQACSKMEEAVGETMKDSAKSFKTIASFFIGLFVAKTFVDELNKNPQDLGGAAKRTSRVVICSFAALGVLLVGFVLEFVLSTVASTYSNTLVGIIFQTLRVLSVAFCVYTIFGLSRVSKGKTFWIRPKMSEISAGISSEISSARKIKIPKIAYIGIEIFSVLLFTMPILNFINEFTVEWADANRNTISNDQLMTLGVAMLAGSAILAAIVGLVICLLLRLFTGGKKIQ